MGKRLLFGILKGLAIGGAIGALLHFALGATAITSWLNYLLYAGVGALSGVLAGRAPWKPGVWVAAILKGIFGLAVGAGLFALADKFGPQAVSLFGSTAHLAQFPLLFAPMLATVYATFVELDDGGEQAEEAPSTGVRAGKISVEDIDVGEDEEAAKPAARSAKKS